jgi:hypothetical protein
MTTQTQFGIICLTLFAGTTCRSHLAPPKASLPVEVRENSHYASDDEIDTNQIVEYLGEHYNYDAENEACYSHQ